MSPKFRTSLWLAICLGTGVVAWLFFRDNLSGILMRPFRGTGHADSGWDEFEHRPNADKHSEWKTPIRFYGRAVDEGGRPLSGADIRFVWTDLSPAGTSEARRVSASDGLFSLDGVTGKHLMVEVQKAGYHCSRRQNQRSFEYAAPWEKSFHTPDPARPVIFHFQKMRVMEDLIVWRRRRLILPPDQTPFLLSLREGESASDLLSADLELVLERDPAAKPRAAYDWSFAIRGLNGASLAASNDEFMVEAPATGYQPSLSISRSKSSKDWRSAVQLQFYVQNPSRRMYAAVHLEVLSDYRLRDPSKEGAAFLKAFVNVHGSRNLEHTEH